MAQLAGTDGLEGDALKARWESSILKAVSEGAFEDVGKTIEAALKDGASGSSRAVAKAVVTDAATLLRETAGTFIASGDAKLAALRTLLTRCTRIIIGQHMDGAEVIFRSALTDVLAAAHDYRASADNLAAAPWDSASLNLSTPKKASELVRVVEYYLKDGDTGRAAVFRDRVKLNDVVWDADVRGTAVSHRFKECQAHLDSSRHKYLSAAVKFSELAAMDASLTGFSAAHSRELLGEAITSAVLAASGGPSRTRVLVELYKDPRSRTLVDHYPLLERMQNKQLLRGSVVQRFRSVLKPHHSQTNDNGLDMLQVAVCEHNLFSASALYENIALKELGTLLDVAPRTAESMAAAMIRAGRLDGAIDQVAGVIEFTSDTGGEVQDMDATLRRLCDALIDVSDAIEAEYPQFA